MKRVFEVRVEASARKRVFPEAERNEYWIQGDTAGPAARRALQLAERDFNGDGLPRRALRIVRIKELGTIDAVA